MIDPFPLMRNSSLNSIKKKAAKFTLRPLD